MMRSPIDEEQQARLARKMFFFGFFAPLLWVVRVCRRIILYVGPSSPSFNMHLRAYSLSKGLFHGLFTPTYLRILT